MFQKLRKNLGFASRFLASWRALDDNVKALRLEVNELRTAVDLASCEIREAVIRQSINARLPVLHRPAAQMPNIPGKPYRLEDRMDDLRALHPAAFDVWIKAFEEGRRSYEADPVNNLSVEGHRDAEVFRAFVAPYMSGSVLDIGCGPQELPVYLRGFRLDRVAGLDPLPGVAKRRMDFCQGFAEFLPWEDAQFDVVLFATSLDHVLSLEKTLDEVCRVLRPGGKCIVWAGLIPGSARYEPDREPVVAVDDYHLFHFSESTLLETFRARFDLFESCVYKANNGFYVFSPSSDL